MAGETTSTGDTASAPPRRSTRISSLAKEQARETQQKQRKGSGVTTGKAHAKRGAAELEDKAEAVRKQKKLGLLSGNEKKILAFVFVSLSLLLTERPDIFSFFPVLFYLGHIQVKAA